MTLTHLGIGIEPGSRSHSLCLNESFLNFAEAGSSSDKRRGADYTQADLQVESAFLSGRIAESQVSEIARHLLSAVSSVAQRCKVFSAPVAALTKELGESWFLADALGVALYH